MIQLLSLRLTPVAALLSLFSIMFTPEQLGKRVGSKPRVFSFVYSFAHGNKKPLDGKRSQTCAITDARIYTHHGDAF